MEISCTSASMSKRNSMNLYKILLVGLGGASGSILRYLFSRLTHHLGENKELFPWGTFGVNIIGCFIIGILFELSIRHEWFSDKYQLFFLVGFCGGFTTFSSYILDGILVGKGSLFISILYIMGSVCLGLIALLLGSFLTRHFF